MSACFFHRSFQGRLLLEISLLLFGKLYSCSFGPLHVYGLRALEEVLKFRLCCLRGTEKGEVFPLDRGGRPSKVLVWISDSDILL
jgi:hypothetical protein